jgi:hypothetical protein
VKRFARSIHTIDRWGAVARPHYFAGVLAAADQALKEDVPEISVFEFGVAGGSGLIELQKYSAVIERQTGIKIHVYGFDAGEGLPELIGDYRDHPDQWRIGDYKMDAEMLEKRLTDRTELRLGAIKDTVPQFVSQNKIPVGFVSCDVDMYSSTTNVLQILSLANKNMLRRVFMYFDDINFVFNHRFAGELLAIDEFNSSNTLVKIDRWRGIRTSRVFSEDLWLHNMFIAHDLDSINKCVLSREPSEDCALE